MEVGSAVNLTQPQQVSESEAELTQIFGLKDKKAQVTQSAGDS